MGGTATDRVEIPHWPGTGQLVVGTLKSVVAVAEYKGGGAVTEQIVLWSTLSECGLKSKRDRDQNENKNYSRSLSLVL